MDRWVKEVEEHAPGIPKVLVGNRLHLAFNRQVMKTSNQNQHQQQYNLRWNRRMLSDMQSGITWASMKCRPWSTSTSLRAFRSCAGWRFVGTEWKDSGGAGRYVGTFSLLATPAAALSCI